MSHTQGRANQVLLAVILGAAGLAVFPVGCGSDDAAVTPAADTGTTADTGATPTDTGATPTDSGPGDTGGGDAGTLSARAQKGLAISPFKLDVTGVSLTDQEQLGTGSYLVNALGDCNGCHANPQPAGPPRYLGGGTGFPIDGAGSVVYARNLTTDATNGLKLTEAEFIDAMRTGKDHKNAGEALIVMPWPNMRWMGTSDLKAIYAYLKKVPAVANPVPNDIKGAAAAAKPVPFPAKFTDGAVDHDLPAETDDPLWAKRGAALHPLADPTAYAGLDAAGKTLYGRGSYIAMSLSHCTECHTNPARNLAPGATYLKLGVDQYMTGGAVFVVPPGLDALTKSTRTMSANLLGKTNGFDFTDVKWKAALVEGKHSSGRPLGFPMSSTTTYKNMVDEDVTALFTYFKSQNKLEGAADKKIQSPTSYCTKDADCTAGTCDTVKKECVGKTCTADSDCAVCQTCATGKCAAPVATSACLAIGL